jgi:hypothetical protein
MNVFAFLFYIVDIYNKLQSLRKYKMSAHDLGYFNARRNRTASNDRLQDKKKIVLLYVDMRLCGIPWNFYRCVLNSENRWRKQ